MAVNHYKTFREPDVALDPPVFREYIRNLARPLWRDFPWRQTSDPYLIWLSEVMLQQTQTSRVEARWHDWIDRFPNVDALATAPVADVLAAWQGMGYNRRVLALHACAGIISEEYGGEFPREHDELLALPGIGPATAAGVRAFAFDESDIYLETNVRAVFIHEFYRQEPQVPDYAIEPLVLQACPESGQDVRGWYYALLDYGAHLKKTLANPTRRARSYTKQPPFEGSFRQKRAEVLRILLDARTRGERLSTEQIADLLAAHELGAGRPAPDSSVARDILIRLNHEGFCMETDDLWFVNG